MSLERAREPVTWLTENLLDGRHNHLDEALSLFHPAIIGHALEALPARQRERVWQAVPAELKGELLLEVNRAVRVQLIAARVPGVDDAPDYPV